MKTTNGPITMMTPGVTSAPFSEAMPLHPKNADEVIAVNLGSSVYTLTGSITGGDVALDAGETAILVYAGSTAGWYVTWRSATGTVTYPVSVAHGGTGADLSGLSAGQMIAFDGSVFAGVNLATISSAPGDTASTVSFWSATDSGATTSNVSIGIELPNIAGTPGDMVFRADGPFGPNELFRFGGASGGFKMSQAGFPARYMVAGFGEFGGDGFLTIIDPTTVVELVSGAGAINVQASDSGQAGVLSVAAGADAVGVMGQAFGAGGIGVQGNSFAGISALFQTPQTDGSNAHPTVDILGNTAQSANLTNWRGTNGTSIVGSMGIGGLFTATAFTATAMPAAAGASGTIYADPVTHALFITP